ncbi:MAG: peroxiredoxin [Planctomycetota bacterium]|nr:peroxiredoxin [Planctomycetota bacterium]
MEANGFREKQKDFAELNTIVVGASTDVLDDQNKFTAKETLNFPLLADTTQELTKACGILRPNGFANRVTFVVDPKGKIAKIYDKVDVKKHPEEVYAFIKKSLDEKK